MSQLAEPNRDASSRAAYGTCHGIGAAPARPLQDQVDEAVRDRATPISRLLRLMSALDADETANENLRLRLRARIGAPLGA